jgi:hypothetical protein
MSGCHAASTGTSESWLALRQRWLRLERRGVTKPPYKWSGSCCNRPVGERVRGISRLSYAWRIAATVLGIGLLLNGSLRMSDDAWPFGPLSQYAFSPAKDATIVITRVEGLLADGRRIDLPLRVESAGISRAEIEARIPEITTEPSLLGSVADGWTSRHRSEPVLLRVWLVQDQTQLVDGRIGRTRLLELATWEVPS